jgi:hypothetical protein
MWEEDPRWQRANYRILLGMAGIAVVGGFVVSLSSDDWEPYCVFLGLLGGFLAVLCAYAGLVWTVGQLSIRLWGILKKFSYNQDGL